MNVIIFELFSNYKDYTNKIDFIMLLIVAYLNSFDLEPVNFDFLYEILNSFLIRYFKWNEQVSIYFHVAYDYKAHIFCCTSSMYPKYVRPFRELPEYMRLIRDAFKSSMM